MPDLNRLHPHCTAQGKTLDSSLCANAIVVSATVKSIDCDEHTWVLRGIEHAIHFTQWSPFAEALEAYLNDRMLDAQDFSLCIAAVACFKYISVQLKQSMIRKLGAQVVDANAISFKYPTIPSDPAGRVAYQKRHRQAIRSHIRID